MKNYQPPQLKHSQIFQITLIQERIGQTVNLLKKSETNLLVEVVGLSVPLKQCLIECVLLLINKFKPESQLKIYSHAAVVSSHNVVMVAMEDILQVLGHIGNKLVLLLVISMVMMPGANHTNSHHVLIMYTVPNITIVHLMNIAHQVVKNNV